MQVLDTDFVGNSETIFRRVGSDFHRSSKPLQLAGNSLEISQDLYSICNLETHETQADSHPASLYFSLPLWPCQKTHQKHESCCCFFWLCSKLFKLQFCDLAGKVSTTNPAQYHLTAGIVYCILYGCCDLLVFDGNWCVTGDVASGYLEHSWSCNIRHELLSKCGWALVQTCTPHPTQAPRRLF